MATDDGADRATRYKNLLQPIRDLAQNWYIDVARDLEEYLDELETITVTFDGGKTNLNFAEAALLIQGSAVVYSRKVEYLYALIYKTLDMLHERAAAKNRDKKVRAEASAAAAADEDALALIAEAEEEFLMLDDNAVPTGRNIDLHESFSAITESARNALAFGMGGGSANGLASSTGSFGAMSNVFLNTSHVAGATPARGGAMPLLAGTPFDRLRLGMGGRAAGMGAGQAGGAGPFMMAGTGAGGRQGSSLTAASASAFRLTSTPVSRSGALLLGGASSSWADSQGSLAFGGTGGAGSSLPLLQARPGPLANPSSLIDEVGQARVQAAGVPVSLGAESGGMGGAGPEGDSDSVAGASTATGSAHGPTASEGGTRSGSAVSMVAGPGATLGAFEEDDAGLPMWDGGGEGQEIDYGEAPPAAAAQQPSVPGGSPPTAARLTRSQTGSIRKARPAAEVAAAVRARGGRAVDLWARLDPAAQGPAGSTRPFVNGRTYIELDAQRAALVASKGHLGATADILMAAARSRMKGGQAQGGTTGEQLLSKAHSMKAQAQAAKLAPGAALSGGGLLVGGLSSTPSALTKLVCSAPVPGALLARHDMIVASALVLGGAPPGGSPGAAAGGATGQKAGKGRGSTSFSPSLIASAVASSLPALSSTLPSTFPDLLAHARASAVITGKVRAAARKAAGLAGLPVRLPDTEGVVGSLAGGAGMGDEGEGGLAGAGLGAPFLAGEEAEGDYEQAPLDYGDDGPMLLGAVAEDGEEGVGRQAQGQGQAQGAGEHPLLWLDAGAVADEAHRASRAKRLAARYNALIDERRSGPPATLGADAGEDESYWREVQARIEAYAAGADAWLSRTKLGARVDKWAAALEPVLAAEEGRPEFDIHTVGNTLLSALAKGQAQGQGEKEEDEEEEEEEGLPPCSLPALPDPSTGLVDFLQLVRSGAVATAPHMLPSTGAGAGGPPVSAYQVARLFQATLQLAASGNVTLHDPHANQAHSTATAMGPGTGGGGRGRAGKAVALATGDVEEDGAFPLSQALPYEEEEEGEATRAVAAKNKAVASARAAALASAFGGAEGQQDVRNGGLFAVQLLHTRPVRPELESAEGLEGLGHASASASASAPSAAPAGGKRSRGAAAGAKGRAGSAKGRRAAAKTDSDDSEEGEEEEEEVAAVEGGEGGRGSPPSKARRVGRGPHSPPKGGKLSSSAASTASSDVILLADEEEEGEEEEAQGPKGRAGKGKEGRKGGTGGGKR